MVIWYCIIEYVWIDIEVVYTAVKRGILLTDLKRYCITVFLNVFLFLQLAGEPPKSLDFQNLSLLVKHVIMISMESHYLPWLCDRDLTVMLTMSSHNQVIWMCSLYISKMNWRTFFLNRGKPWMSMTGAR